MAFQIKNISPISIDVFGIPMLIQGKLDLTTIAADSVILSSLMNGELYHKLMGRMIVLLNPADIYTLGATEEEISFLMHCGFITGRFGEADLKPPFQFSGDGYLLTQTGPGSVMAIEGIVPDGYSAAGVNPVIMGGVDSNGAAQSLLVNADGYLMTSTAISIEVDSEIEGRVLDGQSAAGVKPVIIAGVDPNGNAQSLLTNADGYLMTSTAISIETNSEIEGRVLVGAAVAGIKPVLVGGVDGAGNAQWLTRAEDSAHVSGDAGVLALQVRRDVPISSAGSDGDYATPNQDSEGFNYVRDKAYDAASNANRTAEVSPIWSRNVQTPVAIIAAAQNVTAAWADLGPELALQGYTKLGLWLNIDINDSSNIRIRCLAKHTSAGTGEYQIPIIAVDVSATPYNLKAQGEYYEIDVDADQLMLLTFNVDNFIPYIQFQVMAEVVGATAGQIDEAHVTYGFGG